MRAGSTFHDEPTSAIEDHDVLTQVYIKVEPEPRLTPRPSIRSYEVEDRFAMPSFVPRRSQPWYTQPVRRMPRAVVGLGFAALCVLLGVFIGGLIVFGGGRVARAHAAPVEPRVRAIAANQVTTPAAAVRPALVTVRLQSDPPGATAMIVDGGTTTLVGTTPVDTQLDGSRAYDFTLTLENHATKIVHLDPAITRHVTVALRAVARR